MNLITGDSANQLKKIQDNSVDAVITDPPYGYSFMGKDWDKSLPDIKIFKECYRVMKPGAFAFVMSAPRQDVLYRMMLLLEQSGFLINFSSIYWSYASGFPKSINLSKAADKRLKQERKVIGRSKNDRPNSQVASGMGFDRALDKGQEHKDILITEPASEQAKLLNGAHGGFQMKPAVEIVIVVQKPLQEKSYIDQALKYADEMMNKEQFLEMYDVRNVFQDKLLECGENVEKTFPFLIVPKASKREKGISNNHPTVKPVKLMSYLITLSTREEDIVLDPFLGSGTTGIASKMLNRQFIGIEMSEEYMKIAKARIDATETIHRYDLEPFL